MQKTTTKQNRELGHVSFVLLKYGSPEKQFGKTYCKRWPMCYLGVFSKTANCLERQTGAMLQALSFGWLPVRPKNTNRTYDKAGKFQKPLCVQKCLT